MNRRTQLSGSDRRSRKCQSPLAGTRFVERRLPRFLVFRNLGGQTREIELCAADASEATRKAADLFAHEENAVYATYRVKALRA